jgi:DNA-binding transcriptional MerR regulator
MQDTEVKKIYFTLKEVSKMIEEPSSTVRKWSRYFPGITPLGKRYERRSFNEQDVKILKKAKELLRDRKFQLEGAKKELENMLKTHRLAEQ